MTQSQIKKRVRCAVYTRKSHEEGLDQEYNSIDAQKDAGHAYIAAQRSQGWIPVEDDYDDPAYSGGNMERPALQRLMKDVEANKVDVIVVYKIDRLTRSLHDFSQLVQVFDKMGVSFVAVTQEFNTTTSMGRLMLNVLLSFAQFEREVTAERIRDKIAASKRRGLWVGGMPALGYDVKDKTLIINSKEAATVRYIFKRFIALGSSTLLVTELKNEGFTTKSWTTKKGVFRPGKSIDKGFIYKLLHNRTYLGKISHKDEWYPGKHEAIIDLDSWNDAHAILKKNRRTRANNTRAKIPFLLKGLVFDTDGRALTPYSTHKKKNGKRYRYYISSRTSKEEAGSSGLPYFGAADLEAAVIREVFHLLKSPNIIKEVNRAMKTHSLNVDEAKITVAIIQVDKIWPQLFPHEQQRVIQLLVEKVIVTSESLDIRFHHNGIETLAMEMHQQGDQNSHERKIQA